MSKCIKYQKVRKKVCANFVGGKGRGGKGKHCTSFKYKTVRVCKDFSPKGHGKISKSKREAIRKKIHIGAFGGKGVMSSLSKCKSQVKSQKNRGVPYASVSKRLTLISTWNKRKNPTLSRRAKECRIYARGIYGK